VSIIDGLGLPDPTIQFDMQFGMPAVSQAQDLEMLRLAARLADRLVSGRPNGPNGDFGVSVVVMMVIVLLLVLDLDTLAAAREARDLELGRFPFAIECDIVSDAELDDLGAMRRDVGKYRSFRRLHDKAVSEDMRDLAGEFDMVVGH
jgi:hypothetical protein